MRLNKVLIKFILILKMLILTSLFGCGGYTEELSVRSLRIVVADLVNPYSMVFKGSNEGYVSTSLGLTKFYPESDIPSELIYPVSEGSPSGVINFNKGLLLLDNTNSNLHLLNESYMFEKFLTEGLNDPVSLVSDGEYIYVTDFDLGGGNSKIFRINSSGIKEVYLDNNVVTGAAGITYSEQMNALFYTDFLNGRLLKIDENKNQTTIAEGLGAPVDVIEYKGGFLVADFGDFTRGEGRLLFVDDEAGLVTVTELLTEVNSIVGLKIHMDKVFYTDMLAGSIIELTF